IFGVLHHPIVAGQLPVRTGIVGPVEAALVLLDTGGDGGVHDVRLLRGDGERNAPEIGGGDAIGELAPVRAAVRRLVNRGFRPAGDDDAGVAAALVRGGVHRVGIARIDRDIGDAGVGTDLQNRFPRDAAVGGFVKTAISAG